MGYAAEIAMAREMLAEAGCAVELVHVTTTRDAAKPWNAMSVHESSTDTTGVFIDYRAWEVDGTVVQKGDRKVYVPASGLTFAPAPGDVLKVNGASFRVESVETIAPSDDPILHVLQVRR